MNFPQIPDWFSTALGLITWSGLIFYYFKKRKKKVEVDPEYIEYSTAMGMGSVAFIMVSMAVIACLYSQDDEAMNQATNNMKWIGFILIIIGYSVIEYKFRKKNKRLASQPKE